MRARTGDRPRGTLGAVPRDAGPTDAAPKGIDRMVGGEAPAFESLVRQHYRDVWRLVHRIVRRERDTEEVVGEVFRSARAVLGDHRGEPALEGCLRRLAVEHAVRAVKPGRSRRQELGALEAGLATLGGPPRAALALQLEGLDYAHIARELGVPIGTVHNRLSVAREYLSRSLEGRRAADA